MENSSDYLHKTLAKDFLTLNRNPNRRSDPRDGHRSEISRATDDGGDDDGEVWKTLSSEFERVQSVLDQNRALIEQVNENHRSKSPDNLVKNVSLIREINGNISKVVSIYSDLSVNFTNLVRQRKSLSMNSNGDDVKSNSGNCGSEVVDTAMECSR